MRACAKALWWKEARPFRRTKDHGTVQRLSWARLERQAGTDCTDLHGHPRDVGCQEEWETSSVFETQKGWDIVE